MRAPSNGNDKRWFMVADWSSSYCFGLWWDTRSLCMDIGHLLFLFHTLTVDLSIKTVRIFHTEHLNEFEPHLSQ